MVSNIHQKTCPICGSTVDIVADFCPSCGSELNISATESSDYAKETTSEQNLETYHTIENNSSTFSCTNVQQENIFPISWKIGNKALPLKKKSYVSLIPETERVKTQLPTLALHAIIPQLGIFILSFIFTFLGFVVSSISALSLAGISKNIGFIALTLGVLLIVMPLVNYYRTRLAIYCIDQQKMSNDFHQSPKENVEQTRSNQHFSLYNFILISIVHYIIIALIGIFTFQLFSHILSQSEPIYVLKVCIGVVIILTSLISPVFNIALKLSLIQKNGIFQNIFDGTQFVKVGLKQYLGMILFTFLLPLSVFVLTITSSLRFISLIINIEVLSSTPSLYMLQFFGALILISAIISFCLLIDVDSVLQYNELLSKISVPPRFPVEVSMYNRENNETNLYIHERSEMSSSGNQSTLRCNFCSLEIPPGLNFCPNCGHRIEH